jgi:hypothetical protein
MNPFLNKILKLTSIVAISMIAFYTLGAVKHYKEIKKIDDN